MRRRIQISFTVLAWLCAMGAHWDVAQIFAWSRMYAGYSQTMEITAALQKTFSGEMCSICHAVQEGRQAQDDAGAKAPDTNAAGKAFEIFPFPVVNYLLSPTRRPIGLVTTAASAAGRDRATPPSPPPRAVA